MANIFLIAAFFEVSVKAVEYTYDRSNSTYGPEGWPKTFPVSCNGSRQSPIDIKPSDASYDKSLGRLNFTNWDSLPKGSVVKIGDMNGKSFRALFNPNTFFVSGGGLPGTFYTVNFHFHWGADNTRGSAHAIDGKKFPLEFHFVNVNTKYSIREALTKPDGFAALSILYEIGEENQELKPFFKCIGNVTQQREITDVTGITQALKTLLPKDPHHFYRYNGSLSSPVCQEVVIWTVFKNHKTVSRKQVDMLRGLKAENNKPLVDTFRPLQPLNSRVVKKTFNHAEVYLASTLTTVLSVVMVTVLLK